MCTAIMIACTECEAQTCDEYIDRNLSTYSFELRPRNSKQFAMENPHAQPDELPESSGSMEATNSPSEPAWTRSSSSDGAAPPQADPALRA